MMVLLSRDCERTRSQVSLYLDNEISELEEAMLHAHVARCSACAAFQSSTTAITRSLRLAPLEAPPMRIAMPLRRRTVRRLAPVGAAAAVAVLALGVGTMLSSPLNGNSYGEAPLVAPVPAPTALQLSLAYLDAPRGLPQHPPIAFRPRVGLEVDRSDV